MNWTRHTPCSASQYLENRQDTYIFLTSKAHAATNITTVIITNLRQFLSSERRDSRCNHYTHIILVDNISGLCTSNSPLNTRTPLKSKQIAFIITCIHLHRHCIRLCLHFHSPVPSLHSSFIVIFIHLRHHCQPPFHNVHSP